MNGVDIQDLAWDSDWLGFPVARATLAAADAPTRVAALVARCRAAGTRLLYLVLDPDQPATAQAACEAGAELVDIKLTYQQKLGEVEPPTAPPGTSLKQADTMTPALQQLALQSGKHSRFRRDARIGTAAFEELYTQWLGRTLARGQVWAVAAPNELVSGMLAYAGHEHYASIELLAVAPAARRRGIGRLLVQVALDVAQREGYDALRVVTQGANQPARRLYEESGFQLLSTEHIYHLWL